MKLVSSVETRLEISKSFRDILYIRIQELGKQSSRNKYPAVDVQKGRVRERTWSAPWMLQPMLSTPSFFAIHTRLQSSSKDVTPGVLGIGSWFSTSNCALYI